MCSLLQKGSKVTSKLLIYTVIKYQDSIRVKGQKGGWIVMNKSAKFEYLFKESSHYLKTQFRDKWVLYVR